METDRETFSELTPDELRVALAAAGGATCKEVATELLLSPKTVACHLNQAYGKLGIGTRAELRRALDADGRKPVEVTTLGGLAVTVDGCAVEPKAWQSRKARDLLKLLVARRGRPVHREVLVEQLWPDEDPERQSSRLSVTLSTLRTVLDPEKRRDPDDPIASDRTSLRLAFEGAQIDVETFLADARAGLALWNEGRTDDATALLTAAEASYTGDFLEEDVYAEWAVALREEARLVYVSVARALAEAAVASSDYDTAAGYLRRVLERDPFDEVAHLGLVRAFTAAGRHGEARAAYATYYARMGEIAVEPAAFPPSGPQSATKDTPVT